MDDLISRQAAIDAFRKELCAEETGSGREYAISFSGIERVLNDLPSAQPEIIRCKDCKFWETTWAYGSNANLHYCPLVDGVRREDFYCADAEERRTDE